MGLEEHEFLVSPSILSADFSKLGAEIELLAAAGADYVHVDVMDGHFVPNLTIGAPVVSSLRKVTKLPLDVHLMIYKPERFIDNFIEAGADILTIHVEASQDVKSCLERIRARGIKSGITLRPQTSIEDLEPYLHLVDLVLIMTVNPGFGGQSFMFEQVQKLAWVKSRCAELNLACPMLEVDGGINAETAKLCREADILVAGSYVFRSSAPSGAGSYREPIQMLKKAKTNGF